MQIDAAWVKDVRLKAAGPGRSTRRPAGARLLIASIIACAIEDIAEGNDHAVDAARYFLGPVYQHQASILGHPWPAGLSYAELQQLVASADAHEVRQ